MTTREAIAYGEGVLESARCESPRLDAELLLEHATGRTRTELYAEPERVLPTEEESRLREYLARRARREPAAYIIGEWGFRGLTLTVNPYVLVPRPETEIVVDRALAGLATHQAPRVLDVGTGSGAIALAIAAEHPGADVVATDISAAALAVAAGQPGAAWSRPARRARPRPPRRAGSGAVRSDHLEPAVRHARRVRAARS